MDGVWGEEELGKLRQSRVGAWVVGDLGPGHQRVSLGEMREEGRSTGQLARACLRGRSTEQLVCLWEGVSGL